MAEVMITRKGFKCERCPHKWIPKRIDEMPVQCPRCKSSFWNKPRKNKISKNVKTTEISN